MMSMRRTTERLTWIGVMILAIGLPWAAGERVFAEDNPPLKFQGMIMERRGETLIINERPLVLTRETKAMLGDKSPVPESRLVPGTWVMVVAEPAASNVQRIDAIYVLPHRLNGAEFFALFSDPSNE